jgi:hypothetical protein
MYNSVPANEQYFVPETFVNRMTSDRVESFVLAFVFSSNSCRTRPSYIEILATPMYVANYFSVYCKSLS